MVFIDPAQETSSDVLFLGIYHPYRKYGERNPAFDRYSGIILDLKERKIPAILFFYRRIDPLVHPDIVICTVPSSNPENLETGIRVLGIRLALNRRSDGTSCLRRVKFVKKAALGGPREVKVHLDSIEVQDGDRLKNAEVLLLDDVTTTGSSMTACKHLLIEAGAASVKCLALGKTA